MSGMKKLFVLIIIGLLAYSAKYILFDFPISSGKRVGNLTKISKKGKIFKTWEGTIDEGSGDKLTSFFSVSDDKLGQELYEYEGRQVVIYYEEHLIGFPYDTKYDVTSWKKKDGGFDQNNQAISIDAALLSQVESTLFCAFLGAIRTDRTLYLKVKELIKQNNHYLYQQYQKCNE